MKHVYQALHNGMAYKLLVKFGVFEDVHNNTPYICTKQHKYYDGKLHSQN